MQSLAVFFIVKYWYTIAVWKLCESGCLSRSACESWRFIFWWVLWFLFERIRIYLRI